MYLLASGQGGCMVPIRIGPDAFPAKIAATFTEDGCREEFNLKGSGTLQTSAGGAMTHLPVRVSFPDGSPAYTAQVSISSQTPGVAFYAGFQTDKTGHLDLPAPVGKPFTIQATFFGPGVSCTSAAVEVNAAPEASPTGEIQLPLAGTSCHSSGPALQPASSR
jgi:hypothetical protein